MALSAEINIPYGNACDLAVDDEGEVAEVAFAPDPQHGPEALWFCLRIVEDSPRPGRRLRLVLRHPYNLLGGHDAAAMRPVACTPDGEWTRLGPGRRESLPDGRWQVVWEVDAPTRFLDLAYCYPYGLAEAASLLVDAGWQTDTIGVSQGGRPMIRLSNDYGAADGERPGVYLCARQHSGEVPGSWFLDGLLRRIAALGPAAPLVWAVPFANIDGVLHGDYGKDKFPYDLNRAWGNPPMRHETLVIQRDMQRWKQRCRPTLGIDCHAPGGCETAGIYVFCPSADRLPAGHERSLPWVERFQSALGELAAPDFRRTANYASRWETPTFTQWNAGPMELAAMTFEVPYAIAREKVLTREDYRDAGARVAEAIVGGLEGG